ncbi:MAG TPA: HAMP domain-containing sensor histidine kinase, partial [Actinomycetota bacterium]
ALRDGPWTGNGERGLGLFAVLAVAVLVGELFPIKVRRGQVVDEITTSTTFAFALMLGWGTAAGIAVLIASSALGDTLQRKPWLKVAFNASQYALSLGVAGLAFYGLGGAGHPMPGGTWPSAGELLPLVASAAAFFVLNQLLPGVAVGLAGGVPLTQHLRRNLAFDAAVATALLVMAPVVIVLVDHSPLLLPVIAFPVVTVYVGARAMLRNIETFVSRNAELEELNRLKDDFVAMVSHELRTPLTSIKGSIKTLRQLGSDLDEDDRKWLLEAVDRKSEHLQTLIERLLVVSQLESGPRASELYPSLIELRDLCSEVLWEFKAPAAEGRFNLEFEPSLVEIETDREKVHQILSNLIENAVKYSDQGSEITVRCRLEQRAIVLSVEDHGAGVAPEARGRLFDRFYQADQSKTREVGGIGLGLYISRALARSLGGELWLDERYAGGARFCLRIPGTPRAVVRTEQEEAPPMIFEDAATK